MTEAASAARIPLFCNVNFATIWRAFLKHADMLKDNQTYTMIASQLDGETVASLAVRLSDQHS